METFYCYRCSAPIPSEHDNWIVVETALCKYIVCEPCCDKNTFPIEESDEDIDMAEMDNALADVENAMQEDSESYVSTDASQEE